MTNQIDDICTRVGAYLAVDFDTEDAQETEAGNSLMTALEKAIEAHPGEARLYGLRARMNNMARYIWDAAADWERMLELAPGAPDAAFELAKLRLRHTGILAEAAVRRAKEATAGPQDDANDDAEDEDEQADDWDEAADARATLIAQRYQDESIQTLHKLLAERVAELPFVVELLDELDELYALSPWVHYTLLLKALAAHPGNAQLLMREAAFLASLASYCGVDSDEIPAGYLESISGQRYHVATLARALRAIDTCGDGTPELLTLKAELLVAIDDCQGAASVYKQVAVWFDTAVVNAGVDAPEYLAEGAAAARTRAELCLQGRAALIEDQFSQMSGALDQLAELRRGGDSALEAPHDLEDELAQCGQSLEAFEQAMSEQQRTEYEEMAQAVARQTVDLIGVEPVVLNPIAAAQLDGGVCPWYAEMRPELEGAGLALLQQFDNPSNTRMLGMQCQGQVWTDAGAGSALVAETVRSLRLKRLVTQLIDGSFIMTFDDRGRSFWEYGPTIDPMSVDAETPIGEMVQLHLARVARRLADAPHLHAVPIDSLARLAQVENQARVDKIAFRFSEKITDIEVRGMHVEFHEQFKALLHGAITEQLAALPAPATT